MPDRSPVAPDLNAALKAASVQAAALAMLNAVQHLQRTSVLVEAATALTLVRALKPSAEPGRDGADLDGAGLRASQATMEAAMKTFQDTVAVVARMAETP